MLLAFFALVILNPHWNYFCPTFPQPIKGQRLSVFNLIFFFVFFRYSCLLTQTLSAELSRRQKAVDRERSWGVKPTHKHSHTHGRTGSPEVQTGPVERTKLCAPFGTQHMSFSIQPQNSSPRRDHSVFFFPGLQSESSVQLLTQRRKEKCFECFRIYFLIENVPRAEAEGETGCFGSAVGLPAKGPSSVSERANHIAPN